jgi:hypothetical protein
LVIVPTFAAGAARRDPERVRDARRVQPDQHPHRSGGANRADRAGRMEA